MSDVAISLKGVSKYYKLYGDPKDRLKEALNPFGKKYHHEFYALKDINLEIKKGEILGIVGRNGSGKSTLLKLICGVLTPNQGSVHVDGKISALLELGAGFNPEFTGIKNIYFYATILGLSNKEIDEKLDDIIAFAELGEFMNQPIKTYSSGMKARLGFAVAVHIDPEILILDEVLAVGDVLFRRKCYAKMEEFFKSGKTIIYTSHDTNSINELCTRAVFLGDGSILMDGVPNDVTANYQRYLFSIEENRAKVLSEIQSISTAVKNSNENNSNDGGAKVVADMSDYGLNLGEDYLQGLESMTQVLVQNDRVEIINPFIENNMGRKVNVLVEGREYICRYNVKFDVSVDGVSFGAQLKNAKGLLISGAAKHLMNEYMNVKAGDEYAVEWHFKCSLSEGVYFMDTGVAKKDESGMVFLCRISDACLFRVVNEKQKIWHGLVHLSQRLCSHRIVVE